MDGNRLLVLDDEPAIATLVADIAELCRYEVQVTADFEAFRTAHADWRPSHIVLDLQMPGADGVEVIRYLAGEASTAKLILISGFDARVLEAARRLAKARGLDVLGAVRKPLPVADLKTLLNNSRLAG